MPLAWKGGAVYSPFFASELQDGEMVVVEDNPGRRELTLRFKELRKAERVDRVECFSGKCVFECTWPSFNDGRRFLLFALRIYNWEDLSDPRFKPPRGCLGWLFASPSSNATLATQVRVPSANLSPLDPFGT